MFQTPVRLIAFALSTAVLAPADAQIRPAAPRKSFCHNEASERYLADFRQLGVPKREAEKIVTALVNANPRYHEYFAQCMERWNSKKFAFRLLRECLRDSARLEI